MNTKNKQEVITNMIKLNEVISKKLKNTNKTIENIGYYKDFEFKNSGLALEDSYIVKLKDIKTKKETPKNRDNEGEKEKVEYEIYDKDNNLVATVDENGIIRFEPEFIDVLEQVNEQYFDTLSLDEAEFELPEELQKDDIVLSKSEIEAEALKIENSKNTEKENTQTQNLDKNQKTQTLQNNKSYKQEIDPYAKVTQTETLADMIPEIKQKGYEKIVVDYSDHSKGQNGRFTFKGIDKNGMAHPLESLENTQGTTTGQTVTSINSRDGSVVEEEQVAGLVRINGRSSMNGQEEMLSLKTGPYGTIEVDYVRAELGKDKKERYISAPIETRNQKSTTREVRDFMDKHKNTEIDDELNRAEPELDRDGETEMRNIDDTASNDSLTADDIIVLEDGSKTTLRKEAAKDKVYDVDEFVRRYNEKAGKTPDEKIEAVHDQYEEEFGEPTRGR